MTIADPGEGGSGCEDIGGFIYSGSKGDPYIWVGDMGRNALNSADPGGVPPMGGKTAHGKTIPSPIQRGMELTSVGG